jgi:hypothetical protein
LIKP